MTWGEQADLRGPGSINLYEIAGCAARRKTALGIGFWAQVDVGQLCAVVTQRSAVHPRHRIAEEARLHDSRVEHRTAAHDNFSVAAPFPGGLWRQEDHFMHGIITAKINLRSSTDTRNGIHKVVAQARF